MPPKAAAPEPETPKTFQQHDPYKILLDHSADIQRLFKKHPDLKTALVDIQRATDPPAESQMARQSALPFGRSTFVANGARGNDRQQPPWSRDEGLRNGAAALRAARTDPGDKGDGVREYCELVLYLLSKPAGSQLATAVRQEVLDEETKTISQLMEQEKELD